MEVKRIDGCLEIESADLEEVLMAARSSGRLLSGLLTRERINRLQRIYAKALNEASEKGLSHDSISASLAAYRVVRDAAWQVTAKDRLCAVLCYDGKTWLCACVESRLGYSFHSDDFGIKYTAFSKQEDNGPDITGL